MDSPTRYVSPQKMVELALAENSLGIAYTYTEPLTWYEYVLDTAKLARANGLKNVLVTNGMINEEPLKELMPYIDAANIDLKSMDAEFYRKTLCGDLGTVLNTIRITHASWHIELTNLVIPGYNDSPELIEQLVDFVSSLGGSIPLHFSRYFPHYKFSTPSTPIESLELAVDIATKKLNYVYVGNLWLSKWESTYCPGCGNLLVKRSHFSANVEGIADGHCKKCGRPSDFIL